MNGPEDSTQQRLRDALGQLVFLGFNSRVVALDRDTGEIVWTWRAPKGASDHVAVLLDGDRLIVSIQGYTYCLNPLNGEQIWVNPLKGQGLGIPTLVSIRGTSTGAATAAEIAAKQRRDSSHGAGGADGG